jgi:hypothetical protein
VAARLGAEHAAIGRRRDIVNAVRRGVFSGHDCCAADDRAPAATRRDRDRAIAALHGVVSHGPS